MVVGPDKDNLIVLDFFITPWHQENGHIGERWTPICMALMEKLKCDVKIVANKIHFYKKVGNELLYSAGMLLPPELIEFNELYESDNHPGITLKFKLEVPSCLVRKNQISIEKAYFQMEVEKLSLEDLDKWYRKSTKVVLDIISKEYERRNITPPCIP